MSDRPPQPKTPKLPRPEHFSCYWRWERTRWVATYSYTIPGQKRVTRRLPRTPKLMRWKAEEINKVLDEVKAKRITPRQAKVRLGEGTKLSTLLDAYESDLAGKGCSEKHVDTTMGRVRQLTDVAGAGRTSDLSGETGERLRRHWISKKLAPRTINHCVSAIRTFGEWLEENAHLELNPFRYLKGVSAAGKEKIIRRAPTIEEIGKIVAAAERHRDHGGRTFRGSDRAIVYLVAWATGLRVKELRSTRLGWFTLDGSSPALRVPGEHTKNGKAATQPLPAWLVKRLCSWHAAATETRGAGGVAFPNMPEVMAPWVRKDLAAAGFDFETRDGRFDFHAIRGGFTTQLQDGGASVKEAQLAARHADSATTLKHYTKASEAKIAAAVEKYIPDPTAPPEGAAK